MIDPYIELPGADHSIFEWLTTNGVKPKSAFTRSSPWDGTTTTTLTFFNETDRDLAQTILALSI